MKYLKRIFEQEEVQSQVEQEVESANNDFTELMSALNECIEKCNECSDKCGEDSPECATNCKECSKFCELTLWSLENKSQNWMNLVEMCSEITRSCVESCSKESGGICDDACMKVALECEKVLDGE